MLETVDADADRVTRLIAELLDISRIDSGRLELRRQPVDLAAAVQRHVDGHVAAGQRRDRFGVRVAQPLPALWADPDKIDQVLGNLLENAVRHGEGTVTIEVAPTSRPPAATGSPTEGTAVTVSDEGPGIPEESMRPRLHPLLARQQARRHGPGPLHRQGHRRGARRHHRGRPRARRRRRVPIYPARRGTRVPGLSRHPPHGPRGPAARRAHSRSPRRK